MGLIKGLPDLENPDSHGNPMIAAGVLPPDSLEKLLHLPEVNWTPFCMGLPDFSAQFISDHLRNLVRNPQLSPRKITKTRSSFPTDDAVLKLFYLAMDNTSRKWTMPIRDWKAALNRFAIRFDERMPLV